MDELNTLTSLLRICHEFRPEHGAAARKVLRLTGFVRPGQDTPARSNISSMEIFKWHTFADSPLSQPDQEKDDLMLDHGEGRSTISRNKWFS